MRVRLRCFLSILVLVWIVVTVVCLFPLIFHGNEEKVVSGRACSLLGREAWKSL